MVVLRREPGRTVEREREQMKTNSDILQRLASGDANVLEELVDLYERSIFRYLYHLTGNYHSAEDLAQDTFLAAWRYRRTYNPEYEIRTWLFTIARNLASRDAKRPHHKWMLIDGLQNDDASKDLETNGGGISEERLNLEHSSSAEDQATENIMQIELSKALREVPEKQRAALILHYREGLTFRDVGKALGCSDGAARVLATRGRQALRRILEPILGGGS